MEKSQQLQIVIKALDEATATLKKISGGVKELGDTTDQSGKKGSEGFGRLTGAVLAGNAIIGVAGTAWRRLTGEVGSSVQQANQQELVLARLQAGINNVTSATDKHIGALVQQAQALQETTRFSDDQIISAQGILATYQLNQTAIQSLTPRLIDMAEGLARAGQGMPTLEENAQLVAKAIGGEDTDSLVGVLRRANIMLTTHQTEVLKSGNMQQRFAAITQILDMNVKGLGESAGNTAAGKIDQFTHRIDDAKKQLGQLIDAGLVPVLGHLGNFVKQHQSAVVAVGIAAAATVALTVVLGGLALAIAAIDLAALPWIGLFAVVAVVVGTVLYGAVRKVMAGMKDMNQAAIDAGSGLGNAIPAGAATGKKALQDLQDKLADISDQVKKSERDFMQSLSDIVRTHQSKIDDLNAQINEERDTFKKAQEEKVASFKASQAEINAAYAQSEADRTDKFQSSQEDMTRAHERSVSDIQKDIDREVAKGRQADQQRLDDLRLRLSRENEDYGRQFSDLEVKYTEDTARAKAENDKKLTNLQSQLDGEAAKSQTATDKKLTDLQKQLDQETAFMQKHTSDIASVRDVAALDEIEKLRQTHAEELKQFDKQKAAAIKSAQETTDGMAGEYGLLKDKVDTSAAGDLGRIMGQQMITGLKQKLLDSWVEVSGWITGNIYVMGKRIAMEVKDAVLLKSQADIDKDMKSIPWVPFAEGGIIDKPTFAMMGEGGRKEAIIPLTNPRRAAEVMEQAGLSGGTGVTVHQTNNIYNQLDYELAMRELSWRLASA